MAFSPSALSNRFARFGPGPDSAGKLARLPGNDAGKEANISERINIS